MPCNLPIRVYYEDTDASGVVYHTTYLRYFERARTEWLRALGFGHRALMQDFGIAFTLANVSVDFKRPARLDDSLEVNAEIERVKRASLDFMQQIRRDGIVLAQARARVACVDAVRFRPCALPLALRQALASGDVAAIPPLAVNTEYAST